jgi:uncharacterized protein (UPF0297 family)
MIIGLIQYANIDFEDLLEDVKEELYEQGYDTKELIKEWLSDAEYWLEDWIEDNAYHGDEKVTFDEVPKYEMDEIIESLRNNLCNE